MNSIPLTVADRLIDPAVVIDATTADGEATSLSHGLAGTALLHARLSAMDTVYAEAAVDHWNTAALLLGRGVHGGAGIQTGREGLAASLIVGTPYLPDPGRFHHHSAEAATWLNAYALDLAARQSPSGTTWGTYDAITGLSATGRVLLAAVTNGHTTAEPGLQAALHTLTAILSPTRSTRPGWWVPADHHPAGAVTHPSGGAATGLAHGVAGPLAFLSTAHATGWSVPFQTDAIRHAAEWLLHWRRPDGRWPAVITGDELDRDSPPVTTGRADAWCYGTPGISAALAAAGSSLHDGTFTTAAETAQNAMAQRATAEWDVEGPTVCHGFTGVLQATAHTAIAAQAATAATSAFDQRSRFGFQHHHHRQTRDEPGLLTGAAGTALALADHHQLPSVGPRTTWDCLLNLS